VFAGDGSHEACTAIVWGGTLSRVSSEVTEAEAVPSAEGNIAVIRIGRGYRRRASVRSGKGILMVRRAGSADLSLHGGHVPAWLGWRMTRLGAVIVEAIVVEYGRDELLRRLAHPFWFQSFGAVMGMDWHSSGITTSVLGALKRGLAPLSKELGIHVCGGRGKHSRATPAELEAVGERVGLDGLALARLSRLVAKVRQRRRSGWIRPLPAFLHRCRRRALGRGAAGHER
jgi:hypothetical protein